ncbi:hypothetical protein VHUM_01321 [Vanrija humicola]|uniref:FCP1 homology domain-containing protein n=1 Tax=Vanrija humicola TaxID=5417 RepID=A0A7D8V162_VANHU|nr:hypothetical protein VHUM_01321 [Vanrija humicola]
MATSSGAPPSSVADAVPQTAVGSSANASSSAAADVSAPAAASSSSGAVTGQPPSEPAAPAPAAADASSSSPVTKAPTAPAPAAATTAKGGDAEKAPAAASAPAAAAAPAPAVKAAPSKPASKKRRKRGGLASIFVVLGCLSTDDFEDIPPAKTTAAAKPASSSQPSGSTPTATAAKTTAAPAAVATKDSTAAATSRQPDAATNGEKVADKVVDKPVSTAPVIPLPDGLVPASEPTTAPLEETAGLTSAAVQAPGSGSEIIHQHMLHRSESEHHLPHAHATDAHNKTETSGGYTDLSDSEDPDASAGSQEMLYGDEDYEDEEDRLIAQGGIGIPVDEHGNPAPLLPEIDKRDTGRKCLVLDLDETLLHSSFKMLPSADYIVPVEIESQTHNVYVIKRPGVDHFLSEMGKIYEIVVFTASLSKYADPVLDMLDVGRVVRHRLFRESCYNHKGNYVKDLSQLGRDISTAIIIDNSPASYIFHPNNAVPVSTWFNDPHDTELTDLCPFLTDLATVDDVRGVLDGSI